jgi:hypothetical protein
MAAAYERFAEAIRQLFELEPRDQFTAEPDRLMKHLIDLGDIANGRAADGLWPKEREQPMRRIEQDIRELKAQPGFAVEQTADILDQGVIRGRDYVEHVEGWEELLDQDKFTALTRLDWRGIGPEDRQRLMEREVDAPGIPPAMMQSFLRSDEARSLSASPPLLSPGDIARGQGAGGPERHDGQERGNASSTDRSRGR